MSQVEKILELVSENPDIISKITEIPEFLKGVSGISGTAPMPETIKRSLQSVASANNVSSSMDSITMLNDIKYIIMGILVIWGISLILIRLFVENKELNDKMEYIHTTFLGSMGIFPIIGSIWLLSIIGVTIIPSIIGVLPQIGSLSGALSTFITDLVKQLPKML